MIPKEKNICQFCNKNFYYVKRHESACKLNPINLKICVQCNTPIVSKYSNKFCSKSCSATYNNIHRNRKKKEYKRKCVRCEKDFLVFGYQKKDAKICDTCKEKENGTN